MIRAKLPGGFLTPAQLEALADVAEKYGGGEGHVTTRQIEQLRALIADLGELSDADAVEDDFIDLGETRAFEVSDGEGECASRACTCRARRRGCAC